MNGFSSISVEHVFSLFTLRNHIGSHLKQPSQKGRGI